MRTYFNGETILFIPYYSNNKISKITIRKIRYLCKNYDIGAITSF